MKFFNNVLVHVILAASTITAFDPQEDDSKGPKSLRGKKKVGTDRRRGLKGSKGDDPHAWYPEHNPWQPDTNPWAPEPDPWYPESDPWYPKEDDYVEPDPWYPEPDPWEKGDDNNVPEEPNPWYPEPEKKAKGSKSTKSGGKGGGYPKKSPPVYPEYHDDCRYYKIKLGALQPPASATFPTDGGSELGATFIYNSPLFEDPGLTVPVGGADNPAAFVTGSCTRFQQSMPVEGTNNTVAGAGGCDWTYTINIDGLEGTLEVSGELFDAVKSTMTIVGGTEAFIGAVGQAEYIPSPEGATLDIFTHVDYYNVTAIVYMKECDPTRWKWWQNHGGYWDWYGKGKAQNGYGHGW